MALTEIFVKGAREHNLKNINLTIPREKLVVITGVSGSGSRPWPSIPFTPKGQRRYVESLSAYARQFLEQMEKPEVDFIGAFPTISIEQKTASKNPRSTVGTITEIYDYCGFFLPVSASRSVTSAAGRWLLRRAGNCRPDYGPFGGSAPSLLAPIVKVGRANIRAF